MPAGKPESARGVGSLGSGRGSSGRGGSTASSGGRVRPAAIKVTKPIGIRGKSGDFRYMAKADAPKSVRKSVESDRLARGQKNKMASKSAITKQGTARIVKPSAAGKKAVAKYSGKMKNTPKG